MAFKSDTDGSANAQKLDVACDKKEKEYKKMSFTKIKRHCTLFGIIVGSTSLILSMILANWVWCTDGYDVAIQNIVTFEKDGLIFNLWSRPSVPNYVSVRMFNYTNVQAALEGYEKPNVELIGPYVFLERSYHADIQFYDNGTVSFHPNKTVTFVPEMSNGTLDDTVVVPNIVLLALMSRLKLTKASSLKVWFIQSQLRGAPIQEFNEISMYEAAWGHEDDFTKALRWLTSLQGGTMPVDRGLLGRRNGISPNEKLVGTGTRSLYDVNTIFSCGGQDHIGAWKPGSTCDQLYGSTDGSLFPGWKGGLSKDSQLEIFVEDLCRKLQFTYQKDVVADGEIPAMRFILDPSVFSYKTSKNKCFCMPECPTEGTFNAAPCNHDAPIHVSFPNYEHGDPSLANQITGLETNASSSAYLDIHHLGFPLASHVQLQLGVKVHKLNQGMFKNLYTGIEDEIILPILILDVKMGNTTGSLKDIIYHATYTVQNLKDFLKVFSILSIVLNICLLIFLFYVTFRMSICKTKKFEVSVDVHSTKS